MNYYFLVRSLCRICGVSLADRIRNEHRMVGMKKNVLSWLGHVERMAEKIYEGKVSGKRGRRRSRLSFENTLLMILEEGHVKSMRTSQRACMKSLLTVDEAKEVCRDRSSWRPSPLTTPLGVQRKAKFVFLSR